MKRLKKINSVKERVRFKKRDKQEVKSFKQKEELRNFGRRR